MTKLDEAIDNLVAVISVKERSRENLKRDGYEALADSYDKEIESLKYTLAVLTALREVLTK